MNVDVAEHNYQQRSEAQLSAKHMFRLGHNIKQTKQYNHFLDVLQQFIWIEM